MSKAQHKSQSGRTLKIAVFIIYIIAIVYFMFFGFDRPHFGSTHQEYRYDLVPTGIPLWFPKSLENINLWVFSLGNLLAFVPFGILVPMIFSIRYPKFILIFILSIISFEALQMITYLGSFDTADILVNTIGATIGFVTYSICGRLKTLLRKIVGGAAVISLFTFTAILLAELLKMVFA